MFPTTGDTTKPAALATPALALAVLMLVGVGSCSPDGKDRFMRTFFDGYPGESPGQTEAARVETDTPMPTTGERPEPVPRAASWANRVSTTHADFADECDSCHSPTKVVTPGMCMECHDLNPHGGGEAYTSCGRCHLEHRGREAKLIRVESTRCAGCHAFEPFESKHAQFELIASADKAAAAKRATGLEMLHSLHSDTECGDCHKAQGDGFVPVEFSAACEDCHNADDHAQPGTFDWSEIRSKLAPETAPHVLLSNAGFAAYVDSLPDGSSKPALQEARDALVSDEHEACFVCHDYVSGKEAGRHIASVKRTETKQWFPAARFSHEVHADQDCSDCHVVPDEPEKEVGRLILPGREACSECHNQDGASDACLTCHRYHPT